MVSPCRSWWRNCAIEADAEIRDIDAMEDRIGPIAPEVSAIRDLISTLELCHHKAERWVGNIIEAIGSGHTDKGLGTRSPHHLHPAERVWRSACAALSAWCAGCPADGVDVMIDEVPASEILVCLGPRSPLKEWQVHRVIEKIHSVIRWPQAADDPSAQYVFLLLDAGASEVGYHRRCPTHYREHEDFWRATVRTILHDTVDGEPARLSLGLAIDMLWPCHWRFVENLRIVLDAIGGRVHPDKPFAACGRNIGLLPIRPHMAVVCNTLKAFCQGAGSPGALDPALLPILGEPNPVKRWLVASLEKTLRLQMDPPPELREASALTGPRWVDE